MNPQVGFILKGSILRGLFGVHFRGFVKPFKGFVLGSFVVKGGYLFWRVCLSVWSFAQGISFREISFLAGDLFLAIVLGFHKSPGGSYLGRELFSFGRFHFLGFHFLHSCEGCISFIGFL